MVTFSLRKTEDLAEDHHQVGAELTKIFLDKNPHPRSPTIASVGALSLLPPPPDKKVAAEVVPPGFPVTSLLATIAPFVDTIMSNQLHWSRSIYLVNDLLLNGL